MVELLAPVGNTETLEAALAEGADAVYMGLKSFNARLRASNFAWRQFEASVDAVHRRGKKIFVTVNTLFEENEAERLYRFLHYLNKIGPDAIIVQDFGVVRMVQEFFPNLRIHASTQMNVASAPGVNIMAKEGVRRVVLSRELGLEEIADIRANTTAELEVFVHGALCVSESGLCLFSSYLGGKSANRGMCTQACRRFYEVEINGGGTESGYYFSPHDLQLIEKIPDLIQAGVNSFKIEGRMKSAEYVGSVTAAYRYVIDHWQEDKKGAAATAKRLLSTDFARSKTLYWYEKPSGEHVLNPKQAGATGIFLGKIDKIINDVVQEKFDVEKSEESDVPVKGGEKTERRNFALLKGGSYDPEIGDSIRLHKRDDSKRESHKIRSIRFGGKQKNERLIDIPRGFAPGDEVYLLQIKAMSKRYKRVLPADLTPYRKQPGDERLPILDLTPTKNIDFSYFPQGLYIQVSTIKDAFGVLAEQPTRVILELNTETRKSLLQKNEKIPFSKKQIFISLDPFCPQSGEKSLQADIESLIEKGFTQWVVNNPAHITMLKNKKVVMIGGPYLYTFNRWAVSWLENQNIDAFVMSHEMSHKNVQSMLDKDQRCRLMIPIFSYPALFRMRFPLPKSYDFHWFKDREGLSFRALSTDDGSYVMSEKPFSLIDKVNALKTEGFSHFLIDMSKTQVIRSDFKHVIKALRKGDVIPDSTRFNWKDGFYSADKLRADK
ncbi:MAG: peptidase U32 family protein [Spirochaetales bacterium]